MYRKPINKIGLCRGERLSFILRLYREIGKKLDPSAYSEALAAIKDLYQYFVMEVQCWKRRGAREGEREC